MGLLEAGSEVMIISGHSEYSMVWMSGDKWSFALGLSVFPLPEHKDEMDMFSNQYN